MGNGCFGEKNSMTKVSLKHYINRLKTSAPLQKQKLKRKQDRDQAQLIEHFNKPKGSRTRAIQQCLIQQVVFTKNMVQIWSVVQNCCTKLLDYYQMLQNEQNIQHIRKQIETLLFIKSILNNNDLDNIYKIITIKYLIHQPMMTDSYVINHHKQSSSVSIKMKTEYIMNLCMSKNIQLNKINQIGHNFKYGA